MAKIDFDGLEFLQIVRPGFIDAAESRENDLLDWEFSLEIAVRNR